MNLAGGGTVSFKYDPFGRRIQVSGPSGTTNYVYDGANAAAEVDNTGAAIAHYAQDLGIDEPLAMQRSGALSFYSADGLGSITSLTTGTGALADTFRYDTFGNLASSTGAIVNPYRYTAREYDADSGLYDNRARHYDPRIGRFLSQDPIWFGGGINFYGYVSNNPVNSTDPAGLLPKKKDKWYEYNNSDFQKWFHRCWKQAGDPDATKDEIQEAYAEWVRRGMPQNGKCWNSSQQCEETTMDKASDWLRDRWEELDRYMSTPHCWWCLAPFPNGQPQTNQ